MAVRLGGRQTLPQQGIIWGEMMEKGESRALERLHSPLVKTRSSRSIVTDRN
jgi:hypothetical protein